MNLSLRNNLVASTVGGILAEGLAQTAIGVFGDGWKRSGFFHWWSVVAPIVVYLIAAPIVAHASAIQTVALTGQQAPGTGGVRFTGFLTPELNDAGQIAFNAFLNVGPGFLHGNDSGIWAGNGESLRLIAREGDNPPGTPPSVRFDYLSGLTMNDEGKLVFHSTLAGLGVTPNNDEGIWSDRGGTLNLVARSGDSAPGAGTKVFGSLYPTGLDDSGQVGVSADLHPGESTSDRGMWVERDGALTLVARYGMQVPEAPDGVVFESTYGPHVAPNGDVVYAAIARSGPEGAPIFTYGIWAERQGVQRQVAKEGTPAHGAPPGEHFAYFEPTLNSAGRIAFTAGLQNELSQGRWGTQGIWVESNGSFELVTRADTQAPGLPDETNFFSFEHLRMNDSGNTAFMAWLTGPTVTGRNTTALYSDLNGQLGLIARVGDQPPGIPAGTWFESFLAPTITFNDSDQLAFIAKLGGPDINRRTHQGPPKIVNDHGIWGQDKSGILRLIVKAGDHMDVDDGPGVDLRRIRELRFSQGFNALGQLAFSARFTDGTSGVFLSSILSVPEPNSSHAMLLASGAFVFATRGNRKARLR